MNCKRSTQCIAWFSSLLLSAAIVQSSLAGDADLIRIKGKVLLPDGRPADGAKVSVVRWYWSLLIPHPALAETTTDEAGRYCLEYRKSQFNVDVRRQEMWKEVTILANRAGSAFQWSSEPSGVVDLELVEDDVAIEGQVVDLEGRPVEGVSVTIDTVWESGDGSLDGFERSLSEGATIVEAIGVFSRSIPGEALGRNPRLTDKEGRFRITGIGADRVVALRFSHSSIAQTGAFVMTRQAASAYRMLLRTPESFGLNRRMPVYGNSFVHVSPPGRAVVGKVRDAATDEPMAGVRVWASEQFSSSWNGRPVAMAVTDGDGQFRLEGIRKGAEATITLLPTNEQPYLMREYVLPLEQGLGDVRLNMELHRGIWVTGRVTDSETGKPLPAFVQFYPMLTNERAKELPEFEGSNSLAVHGIQNRYTTDAKGYFRLVGIPGPAIIGVKSSARAFEYGVGADKIPGMTKAGAFLTYENPVPASKNILNIMKKIDPHADGKSFRVDFELVPAR